MLRRGCYIIMNKLIKHIPECIYGNPCFFICINAACRKPGFICKDGADHKSCCSLFHQNCEKMEWRELENIICENPNAKLPEFYSFQEQMETFFSTLIKKVKDQHMNFKKWVMLYGFSQQTMNFINLINQGNYNSIAGVYTNQILSTLFMHEERQIETNFNFEECLKIQKQIEGLLENVKEIYVSETPKEKIDKLSTFSSVNSAPQIVLINSKIQRVVQEYDFLKSMFHKQNVKKFTLLYRASERNFSVAQFHKICDEIPHTLTVIETEYDKVIGGYTPLPWNSSKKHWAADKSMNSFIFSIDLRERFALNLAQFAIACNPQKGPIFGCCDICIVDKSNVEKSNAEFPISYNNFKYSRNADSSTAFTGNAKGRFTTKEWQVYKVEFYEAI